MTFLSESDISVDSNTPVVVESKEIDSHVINKALNYPHACVFVENLVLNVLTIQQSKVLAVNGVPVFWNMQDVFTFIRNFYAIMQTHITEDLLPLITRAEGSMHSANVAVLCYRISLRLTAPPTALKISTAGMLHDIGKLCMPQSFLNSPRWFNEMEKKFVQFHVFYGISLLNKIKFEDEELLYLLKDTVGSHHERLDGSGYARGKKADELMLPARTVAVVDVYDALRSNRPYRTGCDHDLAISYLKAKNGQFDNKIVKILEEVLHESENLWDETQGRHSYSML